MLTWPGNSHLVTQVKAAQKAGIRPCALIFREQPTDPWEEFDYALTVAVEYLDQETCGQCGHPVWVCQSTSRYMEVKVETRVCRISRAVQERQHNDTNDKPADKNTKKTWGLTYFGSPRMLKGKPLPTRAEYYGGK